MMQLPGLDSWLWYGIGMLGVSVLQYTDILPEEPAKLVFYGVLFSMIALICQVAYTLFVAEDETEEEREAKNQGYAFGLAVLHLMKEKKTAWLDQDTFDRVEQLLKDDFHDMLDASNGATTVKGLLLLKYMLHTETTNHRNKHSKVVLQAPVRTRAAHAMNLLLTGPQHEVDKVLSEEVVPGILCDLVVDHLTQSVMLLVSCDAKAPLYYATVQSGLVASEIDSGIQTYTRLDRVVKEIIANESIKTTLKENAAYKVVLIGFGYAASITQLLAVLLSRSDDKLGFCTQDVDCFSIGPFPCINKTIKVPNLYTFVSADDIVPRMYPWNLDAGVKYMQKIGKAQSPQQLLEELMRNEFGEAVYKTLKEVVLDCPGLVHPSEKEQASGPVICGDIYCFDKDGACKEDAVGLQSSPLLSTAEGILQHDLTEYISLLRSSAKKV